MELDIAPHFDYKVCPRDPSPCTDQPRTLSPQVPLHPLPPVPGHTLVSPPRHLLAASAETPSPGTPGIQRARGPPLCPWSHCSWLLGPGLCLPVCWRLSASQTAGRPLCSRVGTGPACLRPPRSEGSGAGPRKGSRERLLWGPRYVPLVGSLGCPALPVLGRHTPLSPQDSRVLQEAGFGGQQPSPLPLPLSSGLGTVAQGDGGPQPSPVAPRTPRPTNGCAARGSVAPQRSGWGSSQPALSFVSP